MLNRDREREILREYEAELADADSVLAKAESVFVGAQREVDELRAIVDRLRVRVGDDPTPARRAVGSAEAPSRKAEAPSRNGPTHYRGRVSLPHFLTTLMADGQRRTVDEIDAAVRVAPAFANSPPNRNTLNTRLSELAKSGKLTKHPDRSYQKLPPAEPSDSGAFERADQTSANPGQSPGRSGGRGNPSGDGLASGLSPEALPEV